jgi:integrase/recombinase XerD
LQVEAELAANTLGMIAKTATADTTLNELWRRFKDGKGRNKSKNTLSFYELAVKKVAPFIGDASLRAITQKDIFDLRDRLRKTEGDQCAAIYLRHLKALLGYAVNDLQILLHNPVKGVDFKPKDRPVLIFKEDEIKKVLEACPEKLRHQCTFLLMTGFRLQESCDLKWSDIDFESLTIAHDNQKGKRLSAYPVRDELGAFLLTLPKAYAPRVFGYSRKGSVDHEFLKVLRKVGLVPKKGEPRGDATYSVHTLKKTYVSQLIQKPEISSSEVHALSHHKSLETTNKYYTWFDTDGLRKKLNLADANAAKRKAEITERETQEPPRLRLVQK